MSKELYLKSDSNLNFSVNTQIKEQLKWLVGLDQIVPGDMLPSANQMADLLNLNRNTINLVYTQLRDEGLFSMQKGRGTEVKDNRVVEELRKKRQAMHELTVKSIEEAKALNIEPSEFFIAALAYVLMHHSQPVKGLRIAFIECREHDYIFYRNEISRLTGAEVTMIDVAELRLAQVDVMEQLEAAELVITTLNHSEEVKSLLTSSGKQLYVIGATVPTTLLLEISAMHSGSKVAFVCLGKAGGQWMASHVQVAGISQIEATSIGMNEREQVIEVLQHSDKVYASNAVFDELKQLSPDKVALYPMLLERSSESLLKDIAATTASS